MDLDYHDLAKLAREFAMNIKQRQTILAEFKLTEAQFAEVEQLDFYKNAFEASVVDWNKPMSSERRLQISSRIMLEEVLPTIGARMKNDKEPLASVVEAGKFLARASGIGEESRAAANPAEKFVITINMGAGHVKTYEKDLTLDQGPKDVEVKAISGN